MASLNRRQFQLKQMAVVAKDFDSNVADIVEVLDFRVCFNDPGVGKFGLVNALFAVGETFLEIVVPKEDNTTAGRLLEKRNGDGGYMVLVQTDDFAAHKEHIETTGVRIIWQSDQPQAIAAHLHPKDVGGAILSIDQMIPADYWLWAGPEYKSLQGSNLVKKISGAVIQGNEPEDLARKWAQIFDLPFDPGHKSKNDNYQLSLDEGVIEFIEDSDGRGPGVQGIILEVHDADEIRARARARNLTVDDRSVTICGTKFYLS